LRRSLWFWMVPGLWAVLAAGCGYRSAYAPSGSEHLSVQVGQVLVPDLVVAQSTASGARAELAAAGRLAGGSSLPRLLVDVLRVDEVSRAVHVQLGQPRAGGMSVAVTVRGRVFRTEGEEATLDTGDLRRAVQLAGEADPRADSAAYDQALRAAAERAGRAAARVALGIPEPADEAP
jgi:hypothetical protein